MPGLLQLVCSAAPLMDSLDVNDTCKRLITNLKMHFCQWRNPTNARNLRK